MARLELLMLLRSLQVLLDDNKVEEAKQIIAEIIAEAKTKE